jgi:hypothetical protein
MLKKFKKMPIIKMGSEDEGCEVACFFDALESHAHQQGAPLEASPWKLENNICYG